MTIFLISKGIDTNAMSPYLLLTASEKVNKAESLWLLIHCDKMAQVDVIPIRKGIHHWFEPKIIFMPSCFPAVYRVCCRIISELTFFLSMGTDLSTLGCPSCLPAGLLATISCPVLLLCA